MAERGGPTTQAGIYYQNSVAALCLGDLLRWDVVNPSERVVEVRLEAPADVDDIVVRHADGHRDWLQVKLDLEPRGKAWETLWSDLAQQRDHDQFGIEDRLLLVLGTASPLAQNLVDISERALHGPSAEWLDRLSVDQRALVDKITPQLANPHRVFSRLRVERIEADRLARDFAPYRLPEVSATSAQLLVYLRDLAGGDARVRGIFTGVRLRQTLERTHGLRVPPPNSWGLDAYLETLRRTARIAVPGTAAGGSCEALFLWPQICSSDIERSQIEDEFGPRGRSFDKDRIDLRQFPTVERQALIVHAGPGFGKSTLLLALAARLADGAVVPATIPLASLSSSGQDVLGFLGAVTNPEFSVQLDWARLAEDGSLALLFDGLDEVAPDKRSTVVRQLQLFTARFPQAAWIMTVRDPAVIPAGFDAPKYEILPLSDDEVEDFVLAWKPDLGRTGAKALVERIDAHQDLATLVRIPLFLSLLVATWDGKADLPSDRAGLIEAYLTTLFRPEEHKDTERAADPERLRAATQALSFALLERGEIGASERDVRKVMADRADAAVSADRLYDDAIRCGLLRRQGGGRLAFPFPIVQEYLAARELIERHGDEIAARAARAAERPWAQVIQFAIEQLPDASAIVRALLDRQDDAFASMARLLGRCIINGMRCDPALAREVGQRLVAAWPRASFWTARRIGQLLHDRWSEPLLPELRKALHNRYLLHDGAGVILTRLKDDDLTLSVVRGFLRGEIQSNIADLQQLVMPLSAIVFEDYLSAVKTHRGKVDRLWAIAVLISRLDARKIGAKRIREVANDANLPDMIRLAACELLEAGHPPDFWDMIERGFRSRDFHRRWAARDALARGPDREERVTRYLSDRRIPKVAREDIVDHIQQIFGKGERCLAYIHGALTNERLKPAVRTKLALWGAISGDSSLFEALVSQIPELASEDIAILADTLSEYPSRDHGLLLVEALGRRAFTPAEKIEVARALMLGARYKLDRFGLRSAGLEPAPPHAAMDVILGLIDYWRTTTHFDRIGALRMNTIATEAGLDGAAGALSALAHKIITEETVGGYDDPFNIPIRSALSALQDRGVILSLEVLQRLIDTSDSNARIGAIYMVGAIGTRTALNYLLELSRNSKEDWSSIFENAEKVAAKLNLKVIRTDQGLELAEPSA